MLDKDLGDALMRLDLAPESAVPTAQIERIIEVDRRRVKRWTRITITLWIVAALGAMFIFIMGGLTFPLIAKLLNESGEGSLQNVNTPFLALAKLMAMCLVIGTASFVTLVAAGLATVWLLVRSRSATLRQINANLLQISDQLKLSEGSGPKPSGGASPSGA